MKIMPVAIGESVVEHDVGMVMMYWKEVMLLVRCEIVVTESLSGL